MELRLEIIVSQQLLRVHYSQQLLRECLVSTAKNGSGQHYGSECTPLGHHIIRAKIGAGQPENTVFVKRRPTGQIYTPELGLANPGKDWILTRILWLCGTEPGFNRFGRVDTATRKIYIHGTPDHVELGKPGSRGCIRMRNQDLLWLYDRISYRTPVLIRD